MFLYNEIPYISLSLLFWHYYISLKIVSIFQFVLSMHFNIYFLVPYNIFLLCNNFHSSLNPGKTLLEFCTLNIIAEYFRFWRKNKEVEIELHNDELRLLKMPNMFHFAEILSFMYLKNVFSRDIHAKLLDFYSRVRIQNVTDLLSERIIEVFPCDKSLLSLGKKFTNEEILVAK